MIPRDYYLNKLSGPNKHEASKEEKREKWNIQKKWATTLAKLEGKSSGESPTAAATEIASVCKTHGRW